MAKVKRPTGCYSCKSPLASNRIHCDFFISKCSVNEFVFCTKLNNYLSSLINIAKRWRRTPFAIYCMICYISKCVNCAITKIHWVITKTTTISRTESHSVSHSTCTKIELLTKSTRDSWMFLSYNSRNLIKADSTCSFWCQS